MRPLDLQLLDKAPAAPDYIVEGLLERQAITILSGDTGACKSMLAMSLAVAIVKGTTWLGRNVQRGRVLYLDGEMPTRIVVDRLRAMGLSSSDSGLVYMNRQGVDLSAPDCAAEVRDLARNVDVVVVDTVMACCGVDVNCNTAVVGLYASVLRPLAADLDVAVLLTHHESKPTGPRNAAMAMMGGRQWAGQADSHLALEVAPKPAYSREEVDGGVLRELYHVRLRTPKLRDSGDREGLEAIVESDRAPDRALLVMTVRSELEVPNLVDAIVGAVKAQGEMTTAQIAGAVGLDSTSSTFKRPRDEALGRGLITMVRRGFYGPGGEAGS